MAGTVFMLFLTVSEQKSKVRLISEFSYLALGKFENSERFFSVAGMICIVQLKVILHSGICF